MSAPKLIDVTPFEPMIVKAHYDFDWEVLRPVCQKMIENTPEQVDVENEFRYSSVYNYGDMPHKNPAFRPFYSWLHDVAQHIIKNEWGYEPNFEYSISNSWVNIHKKGGITKEHHHGPAIMVVATYLQIPEGSGFIEFKDPLEYPKAMNMHYDVDDWVWKKVKAVTGDVLLFPGWIRHRTETNNTNKDRWVLTTNIMNMNRPPQQNY